MLASKLISLIIVCLFTCFQSLRSNGHYSSKDDGKKEQLLHSITARQIQTNQNQGWIGLENPKTHSIDNISPLGKFRNHTDEFLPTTAAPLHTTTKQTPGIKMKKSQDKKARKRRTKKRRLRTKKSGSSGSKTSTKQAQTAAASKVELFKDDDEVDDESSPEPCDGFDNFLEDVGIVGYGFDILLALVSTTSLLVSYAEQFFAYISVYKVAVPSTVLLFLQDIYVPPFFQTYYDILSILDTIWNIVFLVPLGDFQNVIGLSLEVISAVNLFIDTIDTFPDLAELYVELFFGIDLDDLFKHYRCSADGMEQEYLDDFAQTFLKTLVPKLFAMEM